MANQIQQTSINIIAHSQGGLVSRYFLQTPLYSISPIRVNRLMTFGTPHQGVTTACVAGALKLLQCPNSFQFEDQGAWITQLNYDFPLPDLESNGVDYFFVAGDAGILGQLSISGTICAGGESCDGLIKLISALGPPGGSVAGVSLTGRLATYVIPGLWHSPNLSLIGESLVFVTRSDHPGYQLMKAFATDQLTGQLSAQVSLSVAATPDPVKPREFITYSYTVTNRGGTDLSGVVLSTLIPDHTSSSENSITDNGDCVPAFGCIAGNEVRWSLGTLFAGQSRTVQMAARVDSGGITPADGTVIFNSARVIHAGQGFSATASVFTRICTAGGTICNHDVVPPPSVFINDGAFAEGNSGTNNAVFTITLSSPSAATVTVTFSTANGTATAGSDYVANSGSVTFNPGEVSKPIAVAVIGDTVVEPNETFFVNLTSASNAVIVDGQGIGTIIDDDNIALPPTNADFDGDNKSDIVIYRDGQWFILGYSGVQIGVAWGGLAQDMPVPGDYDGDGKTDIAVYRDGTWFIIRSSDGGFTITAWGGLAQDIPVPGDYDGDGKTDIAVYRDGTWFIIRSSDGGFTITAWGGLAQDIPL